MHGLQRLEMLDKEDRSTIAKLWDDSKSSPDAGEQASSCVSEQRHWRYEPGSRKKSVLGHAYSMKHAPRIHAERSCLIRVRPGLELQSESGFMNGCVISGRETNRPCTITGR